MKNFSAGLVLPMLLVFAATVRAGAEWKMVHAHGSELGVHAPLEDHEQE